MQSGIQKLEIAPSSARTIALELLDEISEPMTPRDLDRAFTGIGYTRSEARKMTKALKHCSVIAIVER
jgi:hypothetical protein